MDNESRKWLYKNLRMNGYNVGNTQEEFDKLMDTNEESRKWAYDRAQELGYNVGKDYNEFTSLVGPEKPAQANTEQAAAQAGEAPRQDAVKPTWQQSMAYQMQAGDIARSTQQSMQDFNTRMENIRKGNTLGKTSDYSFNPESGKMEQRYYTTQGDEVGSRFEQSLYNVENEKAEKEQTEKDIARRQVEDLSSDIDSALNDAKGRSVKQYTEYHEKNPLMAALESAAGAADPIEMQRQTYEQMQRSQNIPTKEAEQLNREIAELEAAQRSMRDAKRIIGEADHNAQKGTFSKWLESSFAGGATRGVKQKLFDADTWDFGGSDLSDAGALMTALRAEDSGKPLTRSQQMLLDAKAVELATDAYFGSEVGRGYKAGKVTAESIPFMLEMCINPAAATGQSASAMMTRYALKRFGKQAIRNNMKKFAAAKIGARVAGDIVGAATMAGTTGSIRTAADATKRATGDVMYNFDDEGQIAFAGHTNGEDAGTAIAKAYANTTIENYSEMVGEYFAPVLGAVGKAARKGMGKIGLESVGKFIDDVAASDVAKVVSDFEKHSKWNGVVGEYAEEVAGNIMNAAIVGDQTLDTDPETGVFNLDNNIDTFLGVSLMGGFMSGVKTAGYRTPKYRARQQMRQADDAALQAFGGNQDAWGAIRNTLAFGDDIDVKTMLADVAANTGLSDEQKASVFRYSEAAERYKGMLKGEQKGQAETTGDNISEEDKQEEVKGIAEQYGHEADTQERQDIAIELAETGSQEAQDAWNGVVQRINEDAEYMAAQNRERNKELRHADGSLRPAVLKEKDSEGNNQIVYIIEGNVQMTPDGSMVDKAASDNIVVIYNPATGERKQIDPTSDTGITYLGFPFSPEHQEADIERRKQEYIQEMIDDAQGTVRFAPGQQLILPTGEEAVVVAVSGNGEDVTVALADGTQTTVQRSELQRIRDEKARADYRQRHNIADGPQAQQPEAAQAQPQPQQPAANVVSGAPAEYAEGMEITIRDDEDGVEKPAMVMGLVRYENGQFVPDANGGIVEYLMDGEVRHDHLDKIGEKVVNYVVPGQPEPAAEAPAAPVAGNGLTTEPQRNENGVTAEAQQPAEVAAPEQPVAPAAEVQPQPAEPAEAATDAMPMVGTGEDAEPDFKATTPQRGHRYIYDEAGLSREEANQFVANNIEAANKTLDKVKGKAPKMGTSIAKFNKDKAAWAQQVADAQSTVDYWNGVKAEQDKIVSAEIEAQREKDAAAHDAAVEAEQQRQAEELAKREEQAERGANAVHPAIRDKWEAAPKIEGAENEITLANGERVKGRYVLVESGAATPSHNPNMEFAPSEGFPVDENGQTVNDRDYERDKDAQDITRSMGASYDSRAIQEIPIVSNDGVVLSGNGRTMAGELAAQNNTDGAYIEHLQKYPQQFGFTAEQVKGMQHPRVLFVPDEAMPYTTETFAKFNQQNMKTQSRTEQSVKLGKTVDDETFGRVIQSINSFDSLNEFYQDPVAATNAIGELRSAGAINAMQYAEMFDGEKISGTGRQILENMLIGKAFESNPDAIRQLGEYPAMRQSVISALAEITNNIKLGEDYSVEDELAKAIDLAYQARKSGSKSGEPVSWFARQLNLFPFENGETVADYTNATVLELADQLNSSKVNGLKNMLASYNKAANDAANGQLDIFNGGVKTKQDIINDALNVLDYGTEAEKQRVAATTGQGGSNEGVQQNGADDAGEPRNADNAGAQHEVRDADLVGKNFTLNEQIADNGEHFYQDENGNIDLVDIPQEVFDAIDYKKAPLRLTPSMISHMIDRHGRETGADNVDKAIEFILDVMNNFDHVRLGYNGALIFSIENDRKKTGKRAISILLSSKTGDFYGIVSSGYEGVDKLKKRPELWAGSAIITPATDSATELVTTLDARQGGGQIGSASSQSNGTEEVYTRPALEPGTNTDSSGVNSGQTEGVTAPAGNSPQTSEGKVTDKSANIQENADNSAKESANTGKVQTEVGNEQPVNTNDWNGHKVGDRYLMTDNGRTVEIIGFDYTYSGDTGMPEVLVRLYNRDGNLLGTEAIPPLMFNEEISKWHKQQPTEKKNAVQSAVAAAEAETNTEPTDAQKEAGNYKKGHLKIDGYDVTIENPKGSERSGKDASGKKWSVTMNNTYGYIRGTEGVDGDHIDVFFSDDPSQGDVFVVDQVNADGSFDEHKVMYGFPDIESARKAYLSNYEDGWQGLGAITPVSKEEFKKWINSSHRKTKPFAKYSSVETLGDIMTENTAFSIEPTTYTNKKGKTTPMHLVTFGRELSKEELRAGKELARESRGWWDSKQGGFMMRDEESAKALAEALGNEEAVQDAQPLSVEDVAAVSDQAEVKAVDEAIKVEQEPQTTAQYDYDREENVLDTVLAELRERYFSGDTSSFQNTRPIENKIRELRELIKTIENNIEKGTVEKTPEVLGELADLNGRRRAYERFLRELREKMEEDRRDEALAAHGVKLGDKVIIRGKEATIYDADTEQVTLDTGLAPVMYEVADWDKVEIPKKAEEEAPKAEATKEETAQEEPQQEQKEKNSWVNEEDQERFEKLQQRLRKKIWGQLNVGVDPEILAIGVEMSYLMLKHGARKFNEFAKNLIEALGEEVRPYIKAFYNGARDLPEMAEYEKDMTPYEEVRQFDVMNFDKKGAKDIVATAEHVAREQVVEREAKEATDKLKQERNEERKENEQQVAADTEAIAGEAAAVAGEVESKLSSAGNEQEVNDLAKSVDDAIDKVNEQLALLGYYEGDPVAADYNEAYGYARNAEKKAVKDATKLFKTLTDALGIQDPVIYNAKGKKQKSVAANIAPAGGEVTMDFMLDRDEGVRLYMNISLEPEGDNLKLRNIWFRPEKDKPTGGTEYLRPNTWLPNDVTVSQMLDEIRRICKPWLSKEDYVSMAQRVSEEKTQENAKNNSKNSKSKKKSVSLQQQTMPDLFSGLFDEEGNSLEPQNSNDHDTGRANRRGSVEVPQGESSRSGSANDGGLDASVSERGHDGRGDSSVQDGAEQVRSSIGRSSGRLQGLSERERKPEPAPLAESERKNTHNNHAERGTDYAPQSVNARIEANIAAIETMQRLIESGQQATPEDMSVLRRFSGWGGLGAAFKEKDGWVANPVNKRLREILSPDAYEAANMSRNSAYYTPAPVIDTMWDVARAMGFRGGSVLEGSAGIGNIIGLMPADMSERSDIHAVEIDETTGNILSLLYPDAKVEVKGFEKTHVPNSSVDLAITNVPFVTGLRVMDSTGDKDLSRKFHDIHDFCIAKNVRKLKEGGIGIFITSSGTLDSLNSSKLRNWLVNEGGADVVGAFRMHNQTFGGTGATSDIIVIRKRVNGQKSANAIDVSGTLPIRTVKFNTTETRRNGTYAVTKDLVLDINKHFVEHPEDMAGEMAFAFEKGDNYRATSKALYPRPDINQEQRLSEWARQFADMDWDKAEERETQQVVYENLGEDVKEGSMLLDGNGNLCLAQRGKAVPISVNENKVKGHTKAECFNDYKAIKDALADVLEYQTANSDDKGLKPLLDRLNKAYDDFVKTYGHLNKNTSISFLRNDMDYPSIAALESVSESNDKAGKRVATYGKTDVFSHRVVEKESEPKPTTIKDGIIASIYLNGRVDVPYIAEQLNMSDGDVRRQIVESGLGFENPTTTEMEVSYEYLSGNVREKLRQAQENNADGSYDANIKALERVIPMDIPSHLIEFTLGSSWVEPKLYEDFVKERTGIDVTLTNAGGTWLMKEPYWTDTEQNKAMGVISEKCDKTILGHELIKAAITCKTITVSKTVSTGYGSNKTTETIVDNEATMACANKVDEIRQDFKDWARGRMQDDPEMAERMERVYNELFNNSVPKEIPDEFVPEHFGGAATVVNGKPFKLRPHQAKAAIRATTQPLMLAHEVGSGKTYTLITTAMEMRRLGTARKPMIVVQNATVGQFVASAKALYPNAKILTLEDADRNAEGRRNFYAKIRYNDWDMIVVPQSVFERIPDSEERQIRFIEDKIEEKMMVLEKMREASDDSRDPVVRQAERELEQLGDELNELKLSLQVRKSGGKAEKDEKREAKTRQNAMVKAQEMLDRETDDVADFDDMGIDALLVDEAHEYKHLGFATAMQRGVKGVDPSYSKKSQGVYLKTQTVLEKNNGKNVVFATGTPISNTAAEIWTFMRYLMPADTMREYGIYYFDDFVRNFGNIQQMLEFATNGKYKENNRFAGYVNLPELVRIWSGVTDTMLNREVEAQRKKEGGKSAIPKMEGGKAQDIYLPQTKALRGVMKYVKDQLDEYEKMSGKQKKENSHIPLVMYGIAKAAAVDARLVLEDAEDEPNSKTNEAVRQTLRSLEETKKYKGTVAIFADNYQNKATGFNIYEDIRKKLIEAGVPEDQVVVMKSGMSIKKKLEIFDKVNRGDVRVIMGSTFTLGTGVNIQERLHTLIHVDAPNRPMDYTQRNGRILRQGNLHNDWGIPVRVLRFGVEDSLDVTAYQRLKTKGAIADSIMEGKKMMDNSMENRVLEEEQDLFGDITAQLSGSQYALLKNQVEKEVKKLEARKKQYEADQTYVHNQKPRLKGLIKSSEESAADNRKYLAKVEAAKNDGITIGKTKYPSIDAMADYIKDYNSKQREQQEQVRTAPGYDAEAKSDLTISVGGFDFKVNRVITKERKQERGQLSLSFYSKTQMTYSCPELGLEDVPVEGQRLKSALEDIVNNVLSGDDFRERAENAERAAERYKGELKQVEARDGKPFEYAGELKQAKEKLVEYEELMKAEMAEKEAKYAEMDASVEAANGVRLTDEDSEDTSEDTASYRTSEELNDNLSPSEEKKEYPFVWNRKKKALANIFRSATLEEAGSDVTEYLENHTDLFKGLSGSDEEVLKTIHDMSETEYKEMRKVADAVYVPSYDEFHKMDASEQMEYVDDFRMKARGAREENLTSAKWLEENAPELISSIKFNDYNGERITAEQVRKMFGWDESVGIDDLSTEIDVDKLQTIVNSEDKPTVRAQQTSPEAKRKTVEQMGEKLHTDINIIEDVNEITHPNAEIQERRRKAKGWYDRATGKVYVVLANNRDADDVKATVAHETIAHKSLRELVGEENYDEFLDETYKHLRDDLKKGVDDAAGRAFMDDTARNGERAKSYEEHRRTATDELFGRMAEKPFEEFSQGERTLWQRIKATVRRLLDKFLGTLKLPKWFEIGDNELRYMLWRSKERMERGKEDPIDVARDIVKREELGLGEPGLSKETRKNVKKSYDKEYADAVKEGDIETATKILSKAFKEAFPNTKIVDKDGNPIVVFHGSPYGAIRVFDHTKGASSGLKEYGTYFTTNKTLAKIYKEGRKLTPELREEIDVEIAKYENILENARNNQEYDAAQAQIDILKKAKEGKIYACYLNVEHPKEFDAEGADGWSGWNKLTQDVGYDVKRGREAIEAIAGKNSAAIMDETYDGIIAHNIADVHGVADAGFMGDAILVFKPGQIKSAEVEYDDNGNLISLSERFNRNNDDFLYRDGDETGDIWSDQSMSLQERMTAAAIRLANNHSDNRTLRNDAMRAIGGNLADLRRAMSLQRTFDMTTVKRVADLVRVLMDGGYLNGLSQQEVKRLLAAVKNSVGKNDIERDVQKVMDIMIDNQLKHAEAALQQLEAIRGSKVDARGVEVQGQLDPAGAHIMQVFKKTRGLDKTDIETALADAQQRMGSSDAAVADEAALDYTGLQLAKEYAESIKDSKAEERELREEIKKAHDEAGERDRATESYSQYIASLQEAIRQNKIERAESYAHLVGKLTGSLRGSIENAKAFKEAEKQRIREIQHNANSDMQGRPSDEHYKPKFMDKFVNNSFVSYVFAPLATFDQMLRMFGGKSANGEGYLYNRFMRGWVDAREKEIKGVREKYTILDAKAAELFGGKVKTWGDLIRRVGKLPKATVSFWNGGEMQEHELSQGNLMYIYMVDKMLDGCMKLRRMGITEEDIEDIENALDPRLIQLADWLQDEFLVDTRNEYNKTHKRMFGASMSAIEHYFPLKILANARADKPEDLDNPDKGDGISTATGSIIKRRRNSLALDITGADALSVILDHVAQMEHWNAYAEFNRDLNTLRTYRHFRNQVQNMTTIYGSGKELWRKFNDVCQMAAGTYRPPRTKLDEAAVNFAKGVTAAKVSFRVFTALKQFLSWPAFIPETRPDYLLANLANPVKAWKWSMENMPIFDERWRSRMAGDPRLLKSDMDWKMWRTRIVQLASRVGMAPSAFVDALTISIGAHSIYQTRKARYLREGYNEEQAEHKAIQDAETLYNETQQSSEGAFTSTMQVDRSWLSVMFTVFRNASMSYTRQLYDALRNLKHNLTPGGRARSIEFMTKQLLREWNASVDGEGNWSAEDTARAEKAAKSRFNRQLLKDTLRVATFGYIMQLAWNLGAYLPYLLFGDDDDEKQKMWDDVWAHTMFGSVEGLTGGDVMSDAGRMLVTGEGNPAYLSKDMPLTSDFTEMLKKLGSGKHTEALNDITNLVVQSGIGVNPQSITDGVLAIMDACGDDPELAHEASICVMRILQMPQSQIDKIYFDEVGLSGKEVSKYTPAQLAERYARFKVKRSNFFAPWAWDDEKSMEKFTKKADKTIKERTAKMGDAGVNDTYLQYEEVYKGIDERVKAARKLVETDYVKAAQMMASAQDSKNFTIYEEFKAMDGNLDKFAKGYLASKTPEEAALYRETMLRYKSAMVEVLDAGTQEERKAALGTLSEVMQDFSKKYESLMAQ